MKQEKKPLVKEDERIKKSLKYSIMDGAFYSSMLGFGESFFSAFAVFLKANNLQLGLLGSLPQTLGSFSQLFSNRLLKLFGSRKKMVCAFALLQGLMYVPIALVFFFGTLRVYHLIIFMCLYWIFAVILGPAWNSWMGDLTEGKERGSYFGRRNRIGGFASFAAFLISGYVLQRFSDGEWYQYLGFVVIFSLALISRIISLVYLTKKYEPEYKFAKDAEFSFWGFIREARFHNYGLFAFYLAFMNFAVYLSVPFFTPYMLKDLQMSYILFTAVTASAIISKIIMMPIWGKVSDQFGTKKILTVTGFMMPIVPLLWVFSDNILYLIIIQAYSGFVWAGFELAAFNFIFDTTSPQKRATCVAYFNVLNGVAILSGAFLGSMIVRYNEVFWSKYLLVFMASCLVRYVASFLFIRRLREARQVDGIKYTDLFFRLITMMPTMGMVNQLITFEKGMMVRFEKNIGRIRKGRL